MILNLLPSSAGNKEDERRIKLLERPAGRRRDSSIMNLVGNLIRHTDGSFTKAYHVRLDHSIFTEEHLIERRIDELARLLAARKPPETIIQFRLTVNPDPGRAIQRHLRSQDAGANRAPCWPLAYHGSVLLRGRCYWRSFQRAHTFGMGTRASQASP